MKSCPLERRLREHLRVAQRIAAGATRDPLRREALHHQPARIRPRDLEDVEVGIELDADRADRRDRAVEQEIARRQLQVHRVDELERLANDLERIDLGETRAVVAVVDLAQLGEELLLALARVADAEIGEPLRQGVDVLRRGVDEEPRQLRHVVVGELARRSEVDEPDRAGLLEHEDVRRMRVAVEEAVPEDHRHPRLRDLVREVAPLLDRQRQRVDVGELRSLEPLEREHARARVRPVHLRHVHVRLAGEVVVERLRVPRLEAVVELLADLPRELVDEPARVDEVERVHALLHELRRLVEQRDVGLDLPWRARPLHLDGDLLAVREHRAVHLPDRRGGDGLALELEEEPLDRVAEVLDDHALGLLERERTHVVLEAAQLGDDVRRHDVRAASRAAGRT